MKKKNNAKEHKTLFTIKPEFEIINATTKKVSRVEAEILIGVNLKGIPLDCDPASFDDMVKSMLLEELPRLIKKLNEPGFCSNGEQQVMLPEKPLVVKPVNHLLH
jgi:hypothetical protein